MWCDVTHFDNFQIPGNAQNRCNTTDNYSYNNTSVNSFTDVYYAQRKVKACYITALELL